MSYPIFSVSTADEFGRQLLGEPSDWNGRVLVVYSSLTDEQKASQRASEYINGTAVIDGYRVEQHIKKHGTSDVVFIDPETRRRHCTDIQIEEAEYMERWAEASGREFLGTP